MPHPVTHSAALPKHSLYLPEAILWITGLAALALMQPDAAHLFSFCPFSYVLEWCPGCGLGHGIAWLARGEWQKSWEAHPLTVPAITILCWRTGQLLYLHYKFNRKL
ncbi:DUF2752 domain-containing protein [Pontibacter sp. H259]|uniref:DUF2752 domain-containing protein n=1 Tax=Pontibacter sp. H259 TaxID=3133421 RepID=UPI0030C3B9C3